MSRLASVFVLFVMVPLAICANDSLLLDTPNRCVSASGGYVGYLYGHWTSGDNQCHNGYDALLDFHTTIELKPGVHYANCFNGGTPTSMAVDMDADYCACDNYWADMYQVFILGFPTCACQSGMACQSPWSEYFIGCI